MPSYEVTVNIAAPVERVWAVTRDVDAWPEWTPTVDSVTRADDGPIAVGGTAVLRQPGQRPATWTVDELVENRSFIWHTGGPGYRLAGIHRMEPNTSGTNVVLGVEMSGVLGSLLWPVIGRTVRRFVDAEAAALTQRCTTRP